MFFAVDHLRYQRPFCGNVIQLLYAASKSHSTANPIGPLKTDNGRSGFVARRLLVGLMLSSRADYVDASIMLSHVRSRAPTALLERKASISHST